MAGDRPARIGRRANVARQLPLDSTRAPGVVFRARAENNRPNAISCGLRGQPCERLAGGGAPPAAPGADALPKIGRSAGRILRKNFAPSRALCYQTACCD